MIALWLGWKIGILWVAGSLAIAVLAVAFLEAARAYYRWRVRHHRSRRRGDIVAHLNRERL